MKNAHKAVANALHPFDVHVQFWLRIDQVHFGLVRELHVNQISLRVKQTVEDYKGFLGDRHHSLPLVTDRGVDEVLLPKRGHKHTVLVSRLEEEEQRLEMGLKQPRRNAVARRVHEREHRVETDVQLQDYTKNERARP